MNPILVVADVCGVVTAAWLIRDAMHVTSRDARTRAAPHPNHAPARGREESAIANWSDPFSCALAAFDAIDGDCRAAAFEHGRHGLDVLLACPADPPADVTAVSGGRVWQITSAAASGHDATAVTGARVLVTLGHGTKGRVALDLMAVGVLAVSGDRDIARRLLDRMTTEIADGATVVTLAAHGEVPVPPAGVPGRPVVLVAYPGYPSERVLELAERWASSDEVALVCAGDPGRVSYRAVIDGPELTRLSAFQGWIVGRRVQSGLPA